MNIFSLCDLPPWGQNVPVINLVFHIIMYGVCFLDVQEKRLRFEYKKSYDPYNPTLEFEPLTSGQWTLQYLIESSMLYITSNQICFLDVQEYRLSMQCIFTISMIHIAPPNWVWNLTKGQCCKFYNVKLFHEEASMLNITLFLR